MTEYDKWSADEWWRAQNPGASAARGVLWALLGSAVIVGAIVAGVWLVWP
ncbi:hypothetical protein [Microbacterium sp.]|nr:hypothetical protein [Microbacterium sp.]|tara:strand:- start:3311 stop:3460 length:150 start_codon:yes stop_codon:yes gene_type:complete